MILTKILTVIFFSAILLPVALVFYNMIVLDYTVDPRPEKMEATSEDGELAHDSYAIKVVETYHIVSPFNFTHRFIEFGPRKWVGVLGLSLTVFIYLLLFITAILPNRASTATYEWQPDEVDDSFGEIIIGDESDRAGQ